MLRLLCFLVSPKGARQTAVCYISDFVAMAKVKNAMFFTVKESCFKLAAGYGNTEINDRLNMYRHV